jgi:hypothetical protein
MTMEVLECFCSLSCRRALDCIDSEMLKLSSLFSQLALSLMLIH